MPTRWHFGDVVSKLMETHDPPLDNSQLANRTGLAPNTISNLINGRGSSALETQEKVAATLGSTREAILAEVDRLNSVGNVLPMRSGKDREEDKDPLLAEAMGYARRIVRLDPMSRMLFYSLVASLEAKDAKIEQLERELQHDRERNSRKP